MSKKQEIVEEYWEDGKMVRVIKEKHGNRAIEIPMSEHEYLYGEPDPDDTGEYYTEWMPKYGGRQPDDDD